MAEIPEEVIVDILRIPALAAREIPDPIHLRLKTVAFHHSIRPQIRLTSVQRSSPAQNTRALGHRLIFSSDAPQLETLDFEVTSLSGTVYAPSSRKLSFPFEPRRRPARLLRPGTDLSVVGWGRGVRLLGCCNGLVFVSSDDSYFYIWNPATRFFMELPEPGFVNGDELRYYGAGYLSATDDYRVFAASYGVDVDDDGYEEMYVQTEEMKMFSTKANVWKTIQPYRGFGTRDPYRGTLLNEALHWVRSWNNILVFDFATDEFRRMPLPEQHQHQHTVDFDSVGVSEGCLCVCCFVRESVCYSVDFWVMREYGVDASWCKLFNFSYCCSHGSGPYQDFMVMECCTVAVKLACSNMRFLAAKIDHKEEDETCIYLTRACTTFGLSMTPYEESLIRINV